MSASTFGANPNRGGSPLREMIVIRSNSLVDECIGNDFLFRLLMFVIKALHMMGVEIVMYEVK